MPRAKKNANPFGARPRTNGANGGGLAEVDHDPQNAPPPRAARKPLRAAEEEAYAAFSELEENEGQPARAERAAAAGEVAAMAKLQQTLLHLPSEARARVMVWLNAFYDSTKD